VQFVAVNEANPWTVTNAVVVGTAAATSGEKWFNCADVGLPAAQVYGGKCYMVCECLDLTDNFCKWEGAATIQNFYVRQMVNVAPANPASVSPAANQKGLACSATLTQKVTRANSVL
jgi:hypothetical protein